MGFAGTTRAVYTQAGIQKMRSERKTRKAKVDGVPDSSYIRSMGDLIGAGHLRFVGVSNVNIKTEDLMSNSACLNGGATLFLITLTRVSEPVISSPFLIAPVRRISKRTDA